MPDQLYGPFGALAVLAFVVLAMIRGDIVPGFIYRLERTRREQAETQAERNADSIAQLAQAAADAHAALPKPGAHDAAV